MRKELTRPVSWVELLTIVAALGVAAALGHLTGASPLAVIVGLLIAAPLSTLIHELGHACMAVALTDQQVTMRFGEPDAEAIGFTVGRIDVQWGSGARAECVMLHIGLPRRSWILVILAGPASEVMLGGLLWTAAGAAAGSPNLSAALTATAIVAFLGLVNLVPFRSGDSLSDGKQLLRELRAGPKPVPEAPGAMLPLADDAWEVVAGASQAAERDRTGELCVEHLLDALRGTVPTSGTMAPVVPAEATSRFLRRAYDALSLRGDQAIGSVHLLYALDDEHDDAARDVLVARGIEVGSLRRQAIAELAAGR